MSKTDDAVIDEMNATGGKLKGFLEDNMLDLARVVYGPCACCKGVGSTVSGLEDGKFVLLSHREARGHLIEAARAAGYLITCVKEYGPEIPDTYWYEIIKVRCN